jgi:pimeloyl-ACP methyl ester carboxylesterase
MKKIIRWSALILAFIVAFLGIMFLHFFITSEGDYVVEQTVEQNPSLPHIHIGTTFLHAETFGKETNEVVIVLHGGPGMDFRQLLPLQTLADNYFIVFYDQRGTGLSPRVEASELSMEQMRSDLHQVVQLYAEGRKVNLIGHSWGAVLASIYANAYPHKVNKIVLAEPWVLPIQNNPDIRELGKCWFESLHVKGPDRQADSDYILYARTHNIPEANQSYADYWRYGSLARKSLLNDPLCKEGRPNHEYLISYHTIFDKILFVAGEDHAVPLEDYLINPLDFTHKVRQVTIENTEYLFGENNEETIHEIRTFLTENSL